MSVSIKEKLTRMQCCHAECYVLYMIARKHVVHSLVVVGAAIL